MNETLALVLAWIAGGALGAFFFGGLWWTIRKVLASTKPALWMIGSLLLRMSVMMTGFYYVSGGDWLRLLASLVGFVMVRQFATRLTRLPDEIQSSLSQEVHHAP